MSSQKRNVLLVCLLLVMTLAGFSQSLSIDKEQKNILDSKFKSHLIADINIVKKDILTSTRNGVFQYHLKINNQISYDLDLMVTDLFSEQYTLRVKTENGERFYESSRPIPTNGYISGKPNSRVSLTFNDGFIYGFINDENEKYYIEPISHVLEDPSLDVGYVFYNINDVIDNEIHKCGVETVKEEYDIIKNQVNSARDGLCYEVEWAIASDYLMFLSKGSISAVENHNIGVANDVQTNYDDEFADELYFEIVEQYVVNCNNCDPWTSSTDAGVILNDFADWGPSGFFAAHDIGSLWTDRDFDGNTIGIAFVGVVCTGNRYNCLQDWSNNANLKRVMVAHEIGHNFSAGHDSGNGFIMSPTVNNTNSWSSESINSVENHYESRWCLDDCGDTTPPFAEFDYDVIENCVPGIVQMINNSTAASSYLWEFEGGTPSTSTLENPMVTYLSAGTFNVTLTAYNAVGQDEYVINGGITISDVPSPDFIAIVDENVVTFYNNTQDANLYEWNFGDGNYSNSFQPTHIYSEDGIYEVILTATNNCGEGFYSEEITIATLPEAAFDSDSQEGCNPFEVNFESNASVNTVSWLWSFPGGDPLLSTEENPTVTYNNPGLYDVSLTVTNAQGSDEVSAIEFITVNPLPVPSFNYAINGTEVTFNNSSINSDSYFWDFGDSNTSIDENPVHDYGTEGVFMVTLTATSSCGDFAINQVIELNSTPTAGITTQNDLFGCTQYDMVFENNSTSNTDSLSWFFEGGIPSISSEENPSVSYNSPGLFDVTLIAINSLGADTIVFVDYVEIQTSPIATFNYASNDYLVDFSSQTQYVDNYQWDFGDGGVSNDENPSHLYTEEGSYIVTLTVSNACGEMSFTEEVTIIIAPIANFTSNTQSGCLPLLVEFTDLSQITIENRMWTFEGGEPNVSSDANPMITYDNKGIFKVGLSVSNQAGSDQIELVDYIIVNDIPEIEASLSVDGNLVTIVNNSTSSTNYYWTMDTMVIENQDFMQVFESNGLFTVVLTVENDCGMIQKEFPIEINVYQSSAIEMSQNVICEGDQVDFTANGENVEVYMWTFDGGNPQNSDLKDPVIIYETAGTYTVSLKTTNSFGENTETIENIIIVEETPEADFDTSIDGNLVSFNNISLNAENYEWNFGNGKTNTEENPINEYDQNGVYNVTLIAINGFCTDTIRKEIIIDVSSIDNALSNAVSVYPNPAKNIVYIKIETGYQIEKIKLFDINGKLILDESINDHVELIPINISELNNGTYMLNINSQNKSAFKKLTILR